MDPSTRTGVGRSTGNRSCPPHPAADEASVPGSLRPIRARVTGPGSGIDPELMKRLTQQALEDVEDKTRVRPEPQARDAESDV